MSDEPGDQLPPPFLRTVGLADPTTPISGLSRTVGDFWQWAYSDLAANAVRGVFAEYLVTCALDAADAPRSLWESHDVLYRGTHRIEVKAAGDVQVWAPPTKRSGPTFAIGPKLSWDGSTGKYSKAPVWCADLYVFCHHRATEPEPVSVLDTALWDFYVVATAVLERRPLTRQKRIGLRAIQRLCSEGDGCQVAFGDLRSAVDLALGLPG